MVMAFVVPLGIVTNNQVELEAAILGLTWGLEVGYRNILQEVDSQPLVNWLTHKTNLQWKTMIQVEKLQALINQVQEFKCQPILGR